MKKKEKNSLSHNRSRLLGLMAVLITSLSVGGQTPTRSPLVVNIMVEGLSDDYLTSLKPMFVEGGFKRLIDKGAHISDIKFGPAIDATAAAAIIQTGASPMVNGISSGYTYSSATNSVSPILFDVKAMGNFTDETFSPRAIKVSTITDELVMDTDGSGMAYSIGCDPQIAIISAGHAANGAFWIYDHTGNWATTTYYNEMPTAIGNRNYRTPLRTRLDTMVWTPSVKPADFPLLSDSERAKPFRHTYPAKHYDRFRQFKSTPMANREVTDVALDLISSSKLGQDNKTDMLSLTYTVNPNGTSRAEQIDLYLRLDRDLARLFSAMDQVTAGTPTIVLTGLPSTSPYAPDQAKWRVPTGEYSIKKAVSLLEMFLIATHGNGDWVTGYYNKHFYLNRKLIADQGLNIAQVRTEAADFLARMAGVSNVFTIDDIIAGRASDDPQGLKRNTSIEHAGDIIVEVTPGWVIVDDNTPGSPRKQRVAERNSTTRIPAFILAPGVKATKLTTPVDARAIAPAVSRVLRIRSPNASSDGSLRID